MEVFGLAVVAAAVIGGLVLINRRLSRRMSYEQELLMDPAERDRQTVDH